MQDTYRFSDLPAAALFRAWVIIVASWMLDFRSSGAGAGLAVQGVFLVLFAYGAFSFQTVAKSHQLHQAQSAGAIGLGPIIAFYLICAISTAILGGQDAYQVFKNAFTVVLYGYAAYTTAEVVVSCPAEVVRRTLTTFALGYSIWAVVSISLLEGSIDIETVRYQILGGSTIACLGLLATHFAYGLRRWEMAAAGLTVGLCYLAVTRTYIIVLGVQFAILLLFPRLLSANRIFRSVIVVLIISTITLLVSSDVADRWIIRLLASERFEGIDPTLFTRQSEVEFMLDSLFSSPVHLLFGSGIAAETKYWLPPELGGGTETEGSTGFGHNHHVSILFTGGLLGGLPFLLIQAAQFLLVFRGLSSLQHLRQFVRSDSGFLMVWACMIVGGCFTVNFFSSTFGSRGFSLWYGIGTGLLIGSLSVLRQRMSDPKLAPDVSLTQ